MRQKGKRLGQLSPLGTDFQTESALPCGGQHLVGAENVADEIFDMCIEKLFDSDVDAKELIKKRELYQVLENVTDKCEDAGNVIESIVVKYA